MISSEVQHLLKLADESHQAAKVLVEDSFVRFSPAQSYYRIFLSGTGNAAFKGIDIFQPLSRGCRVGQGICKNRIA